MGKTTFFPQKSLNFIFLPITEISAPENIITEETRLLSSASAHIQLCGGLSSVPAINPDRNQGQRVVFHKPGVYGTMWWYPGPNRTLRKAQRSDHNSSVYCLLSLCQMLVQGLFVLTHSTLTTALQTGENHPNFTDGKITVRKVPKNL